jgi:hypothetical protein
MNSRPILKKAKKISILIDSKSFNNRLRKNDRLANAILSYYNSEHLEFVRTPFETTYNQLNKIADFKIERDESSEMKGIKINKEDSYTGYAFHYQTRTIQRAAEEVYKKESISTDELNDITTVFIQAVFNHKDTKFRFRDRAPFVRYEGLEEPNIYITNNPILLENRYWFEGVSPGHPLNIVSIEEASLLLDAFLKRNEIYCLSSRFYIDKFQWYWYSMRSKIPHYNVSSDITNSIANRLYFILMALDEITIQYYLGSNNVTMDTTLYHFNYLISLISGVFDSLALKTNEDLTINWNNNLDITLSNTRRRGVFLDQIREKNPHLRNHISTYGSFIQLIFSIRDVIIHREGLESTHYSYNSERGGWDANLIEISETTSNYIRYCGDTKYSEDKLTKWGAHKISDKYLLEPHHFSMEAVNMLIKFVDEYLRLLGSPSFIKEQKQQNTDFANYIMAFENNQLGF